MIEAGLVSLLKADSGLTALLAGRIYPIPAPEAIAYPCMTYQVVVSRPEYNLDGVQAGYKMLQFDVYGAYLDCRLVLNALRNALDTFKGSLSDGTRVLGAFRGNESDSFESEGRINRSMCEYEITFVEP